MQIRLLSPAALLFGTIAVAQSPLIYSNGPLITEPHAVSGDASRLQSGAAPAGLQLNVLGFGAQQGAGNALADDFTVCASGMVIDGIEVFGYATGAVPAPPLPVTGVFVEISSTDPAVAITPVAGSPGLANNQIANTTVTFNNLWRVTTTTLTAQNRAVMSSRVNLGANPIILGQGTYWLIFQFTGVNFVPPISVMGATVTGNAKQRIGAAGAFTPLVDVGAPAFPTPAPQGVAFNLYGLSGNSTGSIVNTGLPACGPTTIRVGGAPVLGGFIQTDLSGVVGLGLIGYGFIGVPTPFCGCVVGHSWDAVLVATSNTLAIPGDPSFCGLPVHVQGADLGGAGGCPSPALTFTDTYTVTLQN